MTVLDCLSRNPRTLAELVVLTFLLGIFSVAEWVWLGWIAGVCSCLLSMAIIGFFLWISIRRYKEVRQLALEIDQLLYHRRRINLSDYTEGDLAILKNELSKLVDELTYTSKMLEEEKSSLADSLADISHQIRTPLTAAMLMLPGIASENDADSRRKRIRELESLLDRISWLITTLLKLAKIDNGSLAMDIRQHQIADVIDRAAEPLELLLDIKGIELVVSVSPSAEATCDPRWTAEAVQNILKNAAENLRSGDRVTIEGSEDPLASRISVSDSGPGIPEEDLPYIFERFYRGEAASDISRMSETDMPECPPLSTHQRNGHEGFGIGLSLAQAIVSAQGGTLRASNLKDRGARFDITFPKRIV